MAAIFSRKDGRMKSRGKRLPPRRLSAARRAAPTGVPRRGLYAGMCWCRSCDVQEARRLAGKASGPVPWLPASITLLRINYCGRCGHKRCPCATNCQLACTQSNRRGQPGSHYQ